MRWRQGLLDETIKSDDSILIGFPPDNRGDPSAVCFDGYICKQVTADGLDVLPTAFESFEYVPPLMVSAIDHSLCRLLGVVRGSDSVSHWPAA